LTIPKENGSSSQKQGRATYFARFIKTIFDKSKLSFLHQKSGLSNLNLKIQSIWLEEIL